MKFLFIQKDIFKCYGIMMLSACLKKHGFDTDILIDSFEKDIIKQIKLIDPVVICFSATVADYRWLLKTAELIKNNTNKKIVVGGPLPTYYPELIKNKYIDIICVGEGERVIVEFALRIKKNEEITDIKNLWVKVNGKIFRNNVRDLIENLDTLPYADRDIYGRYSLYKHLNYEVFLAGMGCTGKCTFCFNNKYNELYSNHGKVIRRRSVDHVIGEIKQVKLKNKRLNHILFFESNFLLCSRSWLDEFSIKYKKEINIAFSFSARADFISEDTIKKLKEAGCYGIKFGVESANSYIREKVLNKGITNEQIEQAADIVKRNNIKVEIFIMLGPPGETLNTALETYEFSQKIYPDFVGCFLINFFPGLEVTKIAIEKNLLKDQNLFKSVDFNYFRTLLHHCENKREIVNLHKLFEFGNRLRIPRAFMKYMIKLPNNIVFETVFKICYALGVRRMINLRWLYIFKVAMFSKHV